MIVRAGARAVMRRVILVGFLPLLAACAPKPLYNWGAYEESLQAHYIANDQVQAMTSLEATLTATQTAGVKAPPGVCAEYGFLLYRSGQGQRAIEYFQREATLYPESRILMDKLTTRVRQQEEEAAKRAENGDAVTP